MEGAWRAGQHSKACRFMSIALVGGASSRRSWRPGGLHAHACVFHELAEGVGTGYCPPGWSEGGEITPMMGEPEKGAQRQLHGAPGAGAMLLGVVKDELLNRADRECGKQLAGRGA